MFKIILGLIVLVPVIILIYLLVIFPKFAGVFLLLVLAYFAGDIFEKDHQEKYNRYLHNKKLTESKGRRL
jgi:uncharacterized membrane protein